MNVTLVLYESRYKTGEKIANMICPILGPAKAFDIEHAPEDIKYYSNVVLIFSLYGYESGTKLLDYIEKNNLDLLKVKLGIICVGLSEKDGLKQIEKFKSKIKNNSTFDCFVKGQLVIDSLNKEDKEKIKVFLKKMNLPYVNMGKFEEKDGLEVGKNLREYFNTPNFIPPTNVTLKEIEDFIISRNTCALATGYDEFVRVTPIEYEYYNGKIYIISEGGLKFVGIYENKQVSMCIYEDYTDMNNLRGLQISGEVEVLEPWSEEYVDALKRKNIKLQAISKLPFEMNILKITPKKYEYLYSKFKNLGYNSKQIYINVRSDRK